jgi:hypothetical protein
MYLTFQVFLGPGEADSHNRVINGNTVEVIAEGGVDVPLRSAILATAMVRLIEGVSLQRLGGECPSLWEGVLVKLVEIQQFHADQAEDR